MKLIPFSIVSKEGQKIKLRLRDKSLAREIAALPSDMQELHSLMIEVRGNLNENVYMMVAVWNKFRVYDKFWTTFGFLSEAEYLAYYDLPDGATLAGWSIMVEYFDKDTFILLGDEVIRFMMRSIGEYQNNVDTKKRDYQNILDKYCGIYEGFDKQAFFRVIRKYVDDIYVQPELDKQKITREEFARQKQQAHTKKPIRISKRFKPGPVSSVAEQELYPKVSKDFIWKEEGCPVCVQHIKIIEAARKYISELEEDIRRNLGEKAVPQRPKVLVDL